jgi:acyl-CoA synthetase (AMP-forming)/AMP-acid ligase II
MGGVNIALLLEMAASAAPERIAIGDRRDGITSAQLHAMAVRAAARIAATGAQRVLYTDVAGPALPVALFGAAAAGTPFAPLNYRLADDRLRALVARQTPALLLCGAGTEGRVAGIDGVDVATTADFLASLDAGEPEAAPVGDGGHDDPDAVAVLLHTSGTSGEPKVAVLRHRHLVAYVLGAVELMGAGEDEASLVSVPPYHVAGIAALLTGIYGGRRIVQLPTFDPGDWVTLAREQRVTHTMTVPTMLARILDALEAQRLDGRSPLPDLRHLSYGGGRMPLPVIERAMALLPDVDFVNAYGLTETSSSVAVLGPEDHRRTCSSDDLQVRRRLSSVGRPLPTVDISIRDAGGRPLPLGEAGEIWVRGEQVSGEYVHRDGGGRDDGGWFATRDRGWFDADGYLYVEGRMDDVIVRGGENISPGEIEDVLLAHPAVSEAVVLGLPDDEWGEVVAAVVVLQPGSSAAPGELSDWVVAELRSSRRPAVVEVRDHLPCNDAGKVLRRVVRAELMAVTRPAGG